MCFICKRLLRFWGEAVFLFPFVLSSQSIHSSFNCTWKGQDAAQFQGACVTLPTRLLHAWDFPGKGTGVGCHFLLQGIFLTQGMNTGLPHCRQTLYHLSHQGSHNSQVINPILYSLLEPTAPPTMTGSTKVHWKEQWTQSQEQRGQVLALPLTFDMTVSPEALVRWGMFVSCHLVHFLLMFFRAQSILKAG